MWTAMIWFIAGGLSAFLAAARYYNREIWNEMFKLRLAEIRAKRAKVDAEIDEIYDRRVG